MQETLRVKKEQPKHEQQRVYTAFRREHRSHSENINTVIRINIEHKQEHIILRDAIELGERNKLGPTNKLLFQKKVFDERKINLCILFHDRLSFCLAESKCFNLYNNTGLYASWSLPSGVLRS